jgi:tripartite-type tricarboxylate transporter receptor subunit TctC
MTPHAWQLSAMKNACRLIAAVLLAFSLADAAAAQAYPSRPVRLVVPYPAGGGPDLLARAIGERLTASWGQPIIVENKPGAGTLLGAQEILRSPADGHTIFVTDGATMTINPHLYKSLPYDPDKDFIPVTELVTFYQVLLANTALPANNLREVVAYAKANPGKLSYGSYGIGTTANLSGELVKHATGIDLIHVPYKGAESLTGAIRGEVQFAFAGMIGAKSTIEAGRLKGIAIGGPKRSKFLPDIQTFSEQGYPGVDTSVWFGVWVRAGTPAPIVERINKDFVSVLMAPDFRQKYLEPIAFEPVGSSPADFAARIVKDREFRRRAVEIAGIKPQD